MIDLRSDFLSSPTPAMLAAMNAAAGEAKGYGPRGDPHQARLEARVASLLGKEDALFLPTCMMANLVATRAVVTPGQAVVLDASSHMFCSEVGSIATVAGALTLPITSVRGELPIDSLAAAVEHARRHLSLAMVAIENTHNKAGGVALPSASLAARRAVIGSTWLHLDGSRLPNAAVALGVSMAELAGAADSVALSLNKGLAAPAGAMLAGPRAFIQRATEIRQQLGGGWRPVGLLAAAACAGLDDFDAQLAADHRHAARLADTLLGCAGVALDRDTVQTNLVRATLAHPTLEPREFESRMLAAGVRLTVDDAGAFRLCTYRDIDAAAVDRVCAALLQVLGPAVAAAARR